MRQRQGTKPRHLHFGQHELHDLRLQHAQRSQPIDSLPDPIAVVAEALADDLAHGLVIIDDQNRGAGFQSQSGGAVGIMGGAP